MDEKNQTLCVENQLQFAKIMANVLKSWSWEWYLINPGTSNCNVMKSSCHTFFVFLPFLPYVSPLTLPWMSFYNYSRFLGGWTQNSAILVLRFAMLWNPGTSICNVMIYACHKNSIFFKFFPYVHASKVFICRFIFFSTKIHLFPLFSQNFLLVLQKVVHFCRIREVPEMLRILYVTQFCNCTHFMLLKWNCEISNVVLFFLEIDGPG